MEAVLRCTWILLFLSAAAGLLGGMFRKMGVVVFSTMMAGCSLFLLGAGKTGALTLPVRAPGTDVRPLLEDESFRFLALYFTLTVGYIALLSLRGMGWLLHGLRKYPLLFLPGEILGTTLLTAGFFLALSRWTHLGMPLMHTLLFAGMAGTVLPVLDFLGRWFGYGLPDELC